MSNDKPHPIPEPVTTLDEMLYLAKTLARECARSYTIHKMTNGNNGNIKTRARVSADLVKYLEGVCTANIK